MNSRVFLLIPLCALFVASNPEAARSQDPTQAPDPSVQQTTNPAVTENPGPAELTPTPPDHEKPAPSLITRVNKGFVGARKTTRLEIDLQNAPNSMEPVAEPRQIRIDDRSNVQFLLWNLSPIDVCSRTAGTPTANSETPAIESLVTTLSALGGVFAASGAGPNQQPGLLGLNMHIAGNNFAVLWNKEDKEHLESLEQLNAGPQIGCNTKGDPEFSRFEDTFKRFQDDAKKFTGSLNDGRCPERDLEQKKNDHPEYTPTQVELACEIDAESRDLARYPMGNFRGEHAREFRVAKNPVFDFTRTMFTNPIETIAGANALQADVDEMKAFAADLHKKYDYQQASTGGDAAAPPPVIPDVLMVTPTSLTFTEKGKQQKVSISSGGNNATFTAEPLSDSGWLLLSRPGGVEPSAKLLTDSAPNFGLFTILVSVDSGKFDGSNHYGSILIKGTGRSKGTTIVSVVVKPAGGPTDCDLKTLRHVDEDLDRATAVMSTISDFNKSLQTSQAALKTSYTALVKVEDDFHARIRQGIVREAMGKDNLPVLVQEFNLGTDRKDTSPGYFSCVSDVDKTVATTTNINYTLVYQDVPHWSASAGFLVSFQPNQIIGVADNNTGTASSPTDTQYFTATTRTPVQLIPMAYVNYRLGNYRSTQWGRTKEDELVWTFGPSAGFGVNPNTGTNQPEFFGGFAIGWNHFMLHPGVHVGHTQSLAGGYTFATPVPTGLTAAPIDWSYHFKFSLGFSVRVAPY